MEQKEAEIDLMGLPSEDENELQQQLQQHAVSVLSSIWLIVYNIIMSCSCLKNQFTTNKASMKVF